MNKALIVSTSPSALSISYLLVLDHSQWCDISHCHLGDDNGGGSGWAIHVGTQGLSLTQCTQITLSSAGDQIEMATLTTLTLTPLKFLSHCYFDLHRPLIISGAE